MHIPLVRLHALYRRLIEWVSASCCSLEFENKRESYFWLLHVLELFKPKVWEFSRLNITNNVLSKRKLIKLTSDPELAGSDKYLANPIRGWDDPRLLTIKGLKRRGIPADAINKFCEAVGVSRNAMLIPYIRLEHEVRQLLDEKSSRAMAVLDSLKVTLINYQMASRRKWNVPTFQETGWAMRTRTP